MLNEILAGVEQFNSRINQLKQRSPTYPAIYTVWLGNEYIASTIVRFDYGGVRFGRHCVEIGYLDPEKQEYQIQQIIDARIKQTAEQVKELAVPCQFDDIIGIIPND